MFLSLFCINNSISHGYKNNFAEISPVKIAFFLVPIKIILNYFIITIALEFIYLTHVFGPFSYDLDSVIGFGSAFFALRTYL